MNRKLLFVILTLVAAEVSAGNRTVAIDDAPGLGNTGWVWNNYLPGGGGVVSPDVRHDGVASQAIGFNLQIGANAFVANTPIYGYENGVLSIGGALSATAFSPTSSLGNLNAASGSPAFVVAPFYANLFSAAPGTYPEYGAGEFHNGEMSLITGTKLVSDGAGGFLPASAANDNRGLRVSWFGLTGQPDTGQSNNLRSYGQIDFLDVGTREDGDFDLLISIGLPGEASSYPAGGLGGFSLGNQFYQFTSAAVNAGVWLDVIEFRSGVGRAVNANGQSVTFAQDGPVVPLPSALWLMLCGLGIIFYAGVRGKNMTSARK
jgi:hypothetical protein